MTVQRRPTNYQLKAKFHQVLKDIEEKGPTAPIEPVSGDVKPVTFETWLAQQVEHQRKLVSEWEARMVQSKCTYSLRHELETVRHDALKMALDRLREMTKGGE